MPGVAQQSAEPEAWQLRDTRHHLRRARRLRIDAAAMKADVDLDEHIHLALVDAHRIRPRARDVEIVDDEGEPRGIEQSQDAIDVGRIDRIGKTDVFDAGSGKDFCFPQLRAADADRAARDLHAGKVHGLVRLGVRPQPDTARRSRRLHAVDVSLELGLVDENGGGPKVAQLHEASLAFGSSA